MACEKLSAMKQWNTLPQTIKTTKSKLECSSGDHKASKCYYFQSVLVS